MTAKLLAGDLGMRWSMEVLDRFMSEKGVDEATRDRIKSAAEMMYQYIPYVIEQGENPADGKVLAKFLAEKGLKAATLFGNDGVRCAISIVDFVRSANTAATSTGTGAPPVVVLAYGLALLDLIKVGNSCELAQQGFYEAFLRSSSVSLKPVQTRVRQYYSPDKARVRMP